MHGRQRGAVAAELGATAEVPESIVPRRPVECPLFVDGGNLRHHVTEIFSSANRRNRSSCLVDRMETTGVAVPCRIALLSVSWRVEILRVTSSTVSMAFSTTNLMLNALTSVVSDAETIFI